MGFTLYSWDPTLGSRQPKSRACAVVLATFSAPKMAPGQGSGQGVRGKNRKTRKQARKGRPSSNGALLQAPSEKGDAQPSVKQGDLPAGLAQGPSSLLGRGRGLRRQGQRDRN